MSYTPVEYGPPEWAVVTGSIASTVLFVRLDASGEEAFMDVVGIHENWLCGSPEYWPDVGERIQVCRVPISYPDNRIPCGAVGERIGGGDGQVSDVLPRHAAGIGAD